MNERCLTKTVRPFSARFKAQSFVTFHFSGLAKNPGTGW